MEDHFRGLIMTSNDRKSPDAQPHSLAPPWIQLLLVRADALRASDIHLAAGEVPYARIQGELRPMDNESPIDSNVLDELCDGLLNRESQDRLADTGSVDGAFNHEATRYRFNIFRRRGQIGVAIRRLENEFRTLEDLGLPDHLYDLCELSDGLVLVAGPTGSGKSTTLATLIDSINRNRRGHIITIEDPIEYTHDSQTSLVSQRQIGLDASSFNEALVASLRQDPDVLLVGEIRDLATIRTAITAAETGHLVFATVHASDCVGAIERLISVFPADEQPLIRRLLSMVLRAVISQHLLVARNDSPVQKQKAIARPQLVLGSEVLRVNSAVANLIANSNVNQIVSVMETGANQGMYTLDACLARLWKSNMITEQTATALARHPNIVAELVQRTVRQKSGSLPVTISKP